MKRLLSLALIAVSLALPAQAAEQRKALPQQELTKQETVPLGNNRFLIFSGSLADHGQYGWTIDLVKIDNGIPHFDPLFMEEYNRETNTPHLEYGIAFLATSYHFDKDAKTFTYTFEDDDTHTRWQLRYWLDVDIFKLQEAVSQAMCTKSPCVPAVPKTVFKAPANAGPVTR